MSTHAWSHPRHVAPGQLTRWRAALLAAAVVVPLGAATAQAEPAAPNPNCSLVVPADPLSARGLAAPYRLIATDPDAGACHEADPDQAAFVEATVFDPRTARLAVYHPLVVDAGAAPAVAPTPPRLAPDAVVGIWFGFNGDTLTLAGRAARSPRNQCVNGLGRSRFGQYAYCGAAAFFRATAAAVASGKLTPPAIGTGRDGRPCPTVRDFSIVDQDQSDNVTTTYLVTPDGRLAQDTRANRARLAGAVPLTNGSDNRLLAAYVQPALGCPPATAPDLTDPGATSTALALDELAAAGQGTPVALVPTGDPMTLVNGRPSLLKTDLYRAGVGQPPARIADSATAYCANLLAVAPARLVADRPFTVVAPAPDTSAANLYAFLAHRLSTTFTELGCGSALNRPNPVDLRADADGMVLDATFG